MAEAFKKSNTSGTSEEHDTKKNGHTQRLNVKQHAIYTCCQTVLKEINRRTSRLNGLNVLT